MATSRPMIPGQRVPSYAYRSDPYYRDLLAQADRNRAMSGVEIDVQAMLEEGRQKRFEEELGFREEELGQRKYEFGQELGLRERQIGLAESEWQKRARQYDIDYEMRQEQIRKMELEYEQAELEMEMYRELMGRMDQLIGGGTDTGAKPYMGFDLYGRRGGSPPPDRGGIKPKPPEWGIV